MTNRISSVVSDDEIFYPESDGKPMAENTTQFDLIVKIKEGLQYLFRNITLVFVAGNLLWYPVKGQTSINMAPDAMVVFGRPKGHEVHIASGERMI